ncbi:MbcA/ParS/Xre antitoxin family protein [Microvirga calopogonii]|uniref:antitoxin Xre/MbcA/ParS toxin-binding domain-containing protein n=1 Tax=Microvirga calopogonii TaxID=2078013 RepID=UPI000E0D2B03
MSTSNSEGPHGRILLVQAATEAAHRLHISEQDLEAIIGGSDWTNGNRPLQGDQSIIEMAALFLRVHHSLATLAASDAATTTSWLRSYNTVLSGCPIELIRSSAGLRDVLDYLESCLCR